MLKKTILITLLSVSFAHAETCPTPQSIKTGIFHGWVALNIDDASPLSSARKKKFQHEVQQFALAEWMAGAPEGTSHCYYEGQIANSTYLGVFLAKFHLIPQHIPEWKSISDDILQCHSAINLCKFDFE